MRFPGWLRRSGKDVTVTINGKPVALKMHLGLKGDAYFLEDGEDSGSEDEGSEGHAPAPAEGVQVRRYTHITLKDKKFKFVEIFVRNL